MVFGRRQRVCRYCYEPGHNVRTCPKAKKDAKAPEGNGYAKAVVARASTVGTNRACSYCSLAGHNQTTCKQKQVDYNNVRAKTIEFRSAFNKHCQEIGLNVGALVSFELGPESNRRQCVAMVIGFNPTDLHANTASGYGVAPVKLKSVDKDGMDAINIPVSLYSGATPWYAKEYKVVSPVFNHKLPTNLTCEEHVLAKDDLSHIMPKNHRSAH